MSDISDKSIDASLHDALDNTKQILLIHDGTQYRLPVDAIVTPAVNPYGSGTPVHAYAYDADSDVGDTIVTYTVTTGKILYIYHWGISDNSYGNYELQINGTIQDMVVNETSTAGQRGLNQISYPVPLKATAGQVVRIYKSAGLSNKKTAGTIVGLEVSA